MNDIETVNADEITSNCHVFVDGSTRCRENLLSVTIGRGIYLPGWRWSLHAGPQSGRDSERHIGWVVSGRMTVLTANNHEVIVGPGDFFEVGPNHDAWVLGDEPCVALDIDRLTEPSD
ncbi:MAG: cupin domain-containing protein [Chloroflexi bacterium]|nr:cupin domain-containing protein [Chloroflexota bacterium]